MGKSERAEGQESLYTVSDQTGFNVQLQEISVYQSNLRVCLQKSELQATSKFD